MIASIGIYLLIFFVPLLLHLDWRMDRSRGRSGKRRPRRPKGLSNAQAPKARKSPFRIRNWQIVPLAVGALLVSAAIAHDHGAPEPLAVTLFVLALILFAVDVVLMIMRTLRAL
ncbi:hypothetical protein [Sphingomonas sp. G-3-2-10]|uniref:hypothetical protein n=1 Tax=Sphingomonas sp. G-3-2-10 TaxID=2728838 RepID=UPI00146EC5DB|nr:hypothetical protein [Sphingomonas sp. G-3-2-10]NML05251.1 hypothetical protein [Sphingomonas sp. G-3-2-10]